jgi:hypothetical protein
MRLGRLSLRFEKNSLANLVRENKELKNNYEELKKPISLQGSKEVSFNSWYLYSPRLPHHH